MPDTEAWVGIWRPHKPRGPIAALYGSPGPKYALPGLTGSTKHDPTRLKAPMFSFGMCTAQSNNNFSPGPRYLIPSNMTRVGQDGSPAFSLMGRPKDPKVFKTPGPGEYCPEKVGKLVFPSSPAYSLSARSAENRLDICPGPAAHVLPPVFGPKTVGRATAPSYSFSGRSKSVFTEDMKNSPGPASYKAVDPYIYMRKPPNFSMTGRNHTPGDSTEKPGPGAHYPERVTNTRAKAPSFSFGLRHSQHIAPFIDDTHE